MEEVSPALVGPENWQAADDFLRSAARWAERPAITVAGQTYSYSELCARAQTLAAAITVNESNTNAPVAAIYATRSLDTYAAILAAVMRGYAYVPLNPKFPAERNRYILDRSDASVLLFDQESRTAVDGILASSSDAATASQPHQIQSDRLTTPAKPDQPRHHNNPYAYILFTSGSTGQPKGVAIRHSNLGAYLDATFAVTDYNHQDRMSQNFDLTFDLSAHDMFVCWRAGAHLIVPSAADLEQPADYLRNHDITCWFSVPSLAQKMRLQGALQPGALGNLRLTLFCGEALPVDLAQDWVRATGQRVENWYGPTEATIACTRYRLPTNPDQIQGRFNLVPIGLPLPGMQSLVLKEDGSPAGEGESGELLITGPQVADGYVGDVEKTAKAFVLPTVEGAIHYRTGDRVETEPNGCLQFIDRIDNQIKIRGYRVELGEIEAALRKHAEGCNAVVVPLPLKSATPTSLIGVVEGSDRKPRQLLKALEEQLPDYMSLTRVMLMKQFPKNASGKVDRGIIGQRVTNRLKKRQAEAAEPKKLNRYDKLVMDIQKINPAISRTAIEQAENLMDIGLDSLGFVDFTIRLEKRFKLSLTQDTVAALSHMSMRQILTLIQQAKRSSGSASFQPLADTKVSRSARRQNPHYRAMRSLDMLDKFPDFTRTATDPLVLCVGSSGFMRGLSAPAIEAEALRSGQRVRAANLGMAMLSIEGIAELCEFIRDTMTEQNKRVAHAVLELEIMQLSILPPVGDIGIVADYRKGTFDTVERIYYDASTVWDQDTGGTITPSKRNRTKQPTANWEKLRAREIRQTFVGKVPMDEKSVETWRRGLTALREVSDKVTAVIHPILCDNLAQRRQRVTPNHFRSIITQLSEQAGVRIIPDTRFNLEPEDFQDFNHLAAQTGRHKFSTQIAETLFAPTAAVDRK